MKTKLLFLFLFINIFSIQTFSQEGIPYLSNYFIDQQTQSIIWAIEQSDDGQMFFANREGVLSFDGSSWQFITVPSLTLTIKQINEKTYIGCRNGFGEIIQQMDGSFVFQELLPWSDSIGDITSIIDDENYIFFAGENSINCIEKENYQLKKQYLFSNGNLISDLIPFNDKIYFIQSGKGLQLLEIDNLQIVNSNKEFLENELLFSSSFSSEKQLLAFDNGEIYLFDGNNLAKFNIKDAEYLEESILGGGIDISDETFVLYTLNGGALVIDKKDGKTQFTINYQTGLPDDEVFSIGKDNNGGLWLSHEYGLTRVDLSKPVRNFNFYPGLKGNFNDIILHKEQFYVSTSDGVYYLTEIKDYSEKEITVKIKQKPKPQTIPKSKPVVEEKEESIDMSKLSKKEKRRLKWKSVKSKIVKDIGESIISIADNIEDKYEEPKKVQEYRYIKKKIYSLQSISHGYKKVKGLDLKCKDLLLADGKLLVTTNNGLYEIIDQEIITIIDGIYIHSAYSFNEKIYVGTNSGIYQAVYFNDEWEITKINQSLNEHIYSVVVSGDNILFGGSDNIIYKIDLNDDSYAVYKYEFDSNISLKVIARKVNEKPHFFTQEGVYVIENDSLIKSDNIMFDKVDEYIFTQNDRVWLKNENGWFGLPESNLQLEINPLLLNLIKDVESIYTENGDVIWVLNSRNSIYRIESDVIKSKQFEIFFKSVENQQGTNIPFDQLRVDYTNSALKFTLSAPYFIIPESTQYQYYIKGLMNDWSKWNNNLEINFPFIPPGNYDISIRARNILGSKSEIKTLGFSIKSPFWTAWWFYVLVIIAFVAIAYIVFQLRLKKLQRDKRILEEKVKIRTAEIQRQKEEIQDQKDEIEAQRDMVTDQRDEILKQKDDITASILYAQRIQNAILPPANMIKESLPDHFIFFKPRDIVSGDFYWMKQIGDLTVITAADCTGHGVPGAFMSMLGMTILNDIVRKKEVKQANHILEELRKGIKNSLRQTGKEGEAKDGMDLALCVIDHKLKTLQYSGAYNPLYLYRNNELMEIKADRMPIGIYIKDTLAFTNHEIKLKKGDTFYLFSDGFVDQFGGENGRKFMAKNFKQLLLENYQKPMDEQKEILDKTFSDWKGAHEQIDDVLVIGIKF